MLTVLYYCITVILLIFCTCAFIFPFISIVKCTFDMCKYINTYLLTYFREVVQRVRDFEAMPPLDPLV